VVLWDLKSKRAESRYTYDEVCMYMMLFSRLLTPAVAQTLASHKYS